MIDDSSKQLKVEVYKVKAESDDREGMMVRFVCEDDVFEFVSSKENIQQIFLLILRSCGDA